MDNDDSIRLKEIEKHYVDFHYHNPPAVEPEEITKCQSIFKEQPAYIKLTAYQRDVKLLGVWNYWMENASFSERLCPHSFKIYTDAENGQFPAVPSFDPYELFDMYSLMMG